MPRGIFFPPELLGGDFSSFKTPPFVPQGGLSPEEATDLMGGPVVEEVSVTAPPEPPRPDFRLTADIPGLLSGEQRGTVTGRTLDEWLAKPDPKEAKRKKRASKIGSFLTGAAAGASVTGNPGWTRAYELSRQGELDQREMDAADLKLQSDRIEQGLRILDADQKYRRGEGDIMNDFSVGPDGRLVRNRDIEDVQKQALMREFFPEEWARQEKLRQYELEKAQVEIEKIRAQTASTNALEAQRTKSLQVMDAKISELQARGSMSKEMAAALRLDQSGAAQILLATLDGTETPQQINQRWMELRRLGQGQTGTVYNPQFQPPQGPGGTPPASPSPAGGAAAPAPGGASGLLSPTRPPGFDPRWDADIDSDRGILGNTQVGRRQKK